MISKKNITLWKKKFQWALDKIQESAYTVIDGMLAYTNIKKQLLKQNQYNIWTISQKCALLESINS